MFHSLALFSLGLLACALGSDSGTAARCAALPDSTWFSIEELECGQGPKGVVLCHWTLAFDADGGFIWLYSDVGQAGTWTCADGTIYAHTLDLEIEAELSDATHLSWEDVAYKRD